jgi:hypothetical protein
MPLMQLILGILVGRLTNPKTVLDKFWWEPSNAISPFSASRGDIPPQTHAIPVVTLSSFAISTTYCRFDREPHRTTLVPLSGGRPLF